MSPDDADDELPDEADAFSRQLEAGEHQGFEFPAEEEGDGTGSQTDIFIVDDEEAGRESFFQRASLDLLEAQARATFAEEIGAEGIGAEEIGTDHVDADPAALDAAAGSEAHVQGAGATGETPGDVAHRHLRGVLEALLFVSDHPVKAADLADVARADTKEVRGILRELAASYRAGSRGFQLEELAGGWQLRTSATFASFVRELLSHKPVRLTRAQVETLAIVAYRQPITRPEIEDVRGVDAGAVLKLLLDRDLVRVLGKKDEPGRPLLYGTTSHFLSFFGLKSLRDLPTLREFNDLSDESRKVVERELGEAPHEGQLGPRAPAVVGDASRAAVDEDPEAPRDADRHADRDADRDAEPDTYARPRPSPIGDGLASTTPAANDSVKKAGAKAKATTAEGSTDDAADDEQEKDPDEEPEKDVYEE